MGGVAVVLHGVDRLTADLDLVIELTPESSLKAIEALLAAGYRAKIPTDPRGFADPKTRREWIEEKHMKVLSFWDTNRRLPDVGIFMEYPLDFETLYAQADSRQLMRSVCRVASVEHLIAMKRAVGRPKDLQDIEELQDKDREDIRRKIESVH
ncbi:MAG: nucleotidyl transferase AbiEii/AbiGii toxin family protein [Gammaproteobacteria bacterium]